MVPLLGPPTQIDTKFGILPRNKIQISKITKVRYYHSRESLSGPPTRIFMKFGILTRIKTKISKIIQFKHYHRRVLLWVHLPRLTRNLVYWSRLKLSDCYLDSRNFFRYSDTISRSFWDFIYWILDLASWVLYRGSWILDLESWILDLGLWTVDLGSWIMDLDLQSSIVDIGSWILECTSV